MADPIPLVGPDGREYEIDDPAKLPRALELGYRQATAEAPRTLGEKLLGSVNEATDTAQAGASGLVQGVTGGLYGAGLGGSLSGSGEAPDDAALRKFEAEKLTQGREAHPIAAGVGELAGMVLSPINKLAAPIEGAIGATSVLGRIAAKGVSNAAVGSLFGAGNTVSDAALGDQDLTAEKLISGAGLGAVLGAGGGMLGGAVEEGAAKLLPKATKALEGAGDALSEFADKRWLKTAGIQSDIKKIPLNEHEAVADVLRRHVGPSGNLKDAAEAVGKERAAVSDAVLKDIGVGDAGGLKPSMDHEEALEALNKGFDENGKRVGDILKNADASGAKPVHADFQKRIDQFVEGLNPVERDIIGPDVGKIKGYLQKAGGMEHSDIGWVKTGPASGFEELNGIKSTLQKDINYAADSGAKASLKKQLVGVIRDEIDTQLAPQIGSDLSKEFINSKNAYGALKQAAKAVKGKGKNGADAIEALVKGAGIDTPEVAKLSALGHADRLIKGGLDRGMNRVISPSDYLTGIGAATLHGGPLGALTGIASALGHKVLREHGSALIATLADRIAASPALSTVAASFGKQLGAVGPALGRYAAPMTQALQHGAATALATHMVTAQADPDYAQTAQAAGFTPESDAQHAAALGKAHAISGVAAVLSQHDEALDRGINHVLRGTKEPRPVAEVMGSQDFGAKRMRRDSSDAHVKRVEEIRQLAANPQALVDRVAANMGNLGNHAPGVAAAITKTAHSAVQFLANEATQPPKAGPLAPDWVHSEAEKHAFASMLQAVQDPMSVLHHAAAGTLTEDQMRAFTTVYPTLARQVADKTLMRMSESPKSVPYKSRVMLSLLTGVDPDGTMSQGAIAANQAAISTASRQSAKPSNQAGGKTDGKLTLADRTAMPEQKRQLQQE